MQDYNEPSSFNRHDMKLQAYLDTRNLRATYNKDTEPSLSKIEKLRSETLSLNEPEEPTHYKTPYVDIMSDTPDKIANKWRKDMTFQAQSEQISNNAIIDELDWKPSKIKSELTQEMIDEYKAENTSPIKLYGKSYAYHPDRLNIELETFTPKPILTVSDIIALEGAKTKHAEKMDKHEVAIRELIDVIKPQIDITYNDLKAGAITGVMSVASMTLRINSLQAEKQRVENFTKAEAQQEADKIGILYKPNEHAKTIKNKIIKVINKEINALNKTLGAKSKTPEEIDEDYKQEMLRFNEAIENHISMSKNHREQIQLIDDYIRQTLDNEHENTTEEIRIARKNADKIKTMEDELNVLNAGKMVMAMQPGETAEEYKNRLVSTGQATFNDKAIEEQAITTQLIRCRNNLKTLLSDLGKISTVANKLTPDERFEYNKYAVAINKKYLDTHGFDSKNMTESGIVDFIKEALATKNFTMTTAPTPPTAPATAPKLPKTDYYPISHYSKGELVDMVDAYGLRRGTRESMYNELLLAGYISLKGMPKIDLPLVPTAPIMPVAPAGPIILGAAAPIGAGLGAKYQKLPEFVPFGDYYISPQKLYYQNVLAIRSHTKKPITGYKDQRITDALSSIIMKVLKDETVKRHDIALLTDNERMIYDNLMFMGKMHKSHHNTVDETAQKMKDRFTILEGEIEAGNDNPDILKEIHSLLYKMAKNKIITHKSATEYWNNLKSTFLNRIKSFAF